MKKFDLTKALAGEPLVTRDGQPATQFTRFDCDSVYPLRAVVNRVVMFFTIDGTNALNGKSSFDLFMAEPERWVNVYFNPEDNICWTTASPFQSQERAQSLIDNDNLQYYQTTIKLK